MSRNALLFLVLLVAACSNSDGKENAQTADSGMPGADADGSCESSQTAFRAALSAISTTCSVDADCVVVEDIRSCNCSGGVSATADLTDVEALRGSFSGDCAHPLECLNSSFCPYDVFGASEMEAACINDTCVELPQLACDDIANVLANARYCASDDDCEVRTDVDACGCSVAVSTGIDEPNGSDEQGAGLIAKRLIDRCDFTETCALIDCVAGATSRCSDQGTCELVP